MTLKKEEEKMKVDLTPREIELILLLVGDSAASEFEFDEPSLYSMEELTLISKLESALKQNSHALDLSEMGTSTLRH